MLEYLRAARDQQAFRVPTNLEEWELANLAAEAQYYGLTELHESLQAAAAPAAPVAATKPFAQTFLQKQSERPELSHRP